MGNSRVKRKFRASTVLFVLAAATICGSWLGAFPPEWVESVYAARVFPIISPIMARFADALPVSWLDLALLLALALLVFGIRARKWRFMLAVVAASYLWFFWSWGWR